MKKKHSLIRKATFIMGALIFYVFSVAFWRHSSQTKLLVKTRTPINCSSMIGNAELDCWKNQLNFTIQEHGIDAALVEVAQLSDSDPSFLSNCHSLMHLVGQKAYNLYSHNKDFAVSPKITYCSYGFYHGFMEELLQSTGDFQTARNFCAYINKELSNFGLDLSSECYHGIGHGVVIDSDGVFTGDITGLVSGTLGLCRKIATNDDQIMQCASGVFNGIANSYTEGSKYFIINKEDPLWLCGLQGASVRPTCYGLMARVYSAAHNNNFSEAIKQAAELTPKQYQYNVIANIAALYIASNYKTEAETLELCRAIVLGLQPDCIKGMAVGLFQSGKPEREYERPLAFCDQLQGSDRGVCYEKLLPYFKKVYYGKQLEFVCAGVEKNYKNLCLGSA